MGQDGVVVGFFFARLAGCNRRCLTDDQPTLLRAHAPSAQLMNFSLTLLRSAFQPKSLILAVGQSHRLQIARSWQVSLGRIHLSLLLSSGLAFLFHFCPPCSSLALVHRPKLCSNKTPRL